MGLLQEQVPVPQNHSAFDNSFLRLGDTVAGGQDVFRSLIVPNVPRASSVASMGEAKRYISRVRTDLFVVDFIIK